MSARSARLSQFSFTMREVSTVREASRARDEPRDRVGRIFDIGVGEKEIVRDVLHRLGMGNALLHGPDLARPARRQRLAVKHSDLAIESGGERAGDRAGAVARVVIDHDDGKPARVILRRQRCQRSRQRESLVAGRDHRDDARPVTIGRRGRPIAILAIAGKPKAAAKQQEINPDAKRKRGDDQGRRHDK